MDFYDELFMYVINILAHIIEHSLTRGIRN